MLKRVFLAALILATQTASLIAGPVRGRSFVVPFHLSNISDGADVTSGTVTVKISKDGAAATTSTNSAVHRTDGQWDVTLTAAEANASSIAVTAVESGSYSVTQTIMTEPPVPPSRWLTKYDGIPKGSLLSTFARAQTTVDDNGAPVPANTRRFSATNQSTAGLVDFQSTGYDLGTQASILMGGRDLDGTGLLVVYDQPAGDVDILKVNSNRTATLQTSTDVTAFPGAGGSISYIPRSARVVYGTIFVFMQRTNSAVIEGITIMYTQDNGATWSRVENSAADGGGFDVPKASVYGSNADSIPRGREWMSAIYPVGGVDSNGNFNENDFFVTWVDYLHPGSPVPKGWQCGTFRISRQASDQDFTIAKNRVLYQRWEAGVTSTNCHGHTVGLTGNGMFVLANGDVEGQHAFHAISVDLNTYESAAITVTPDWFGQTVGGAANGKGCPQLSMSFPGWGGTVCGSNDTWPSPILKFNNAATPSEACVLSSVVYIESDIFAGGFKVGWDNVWAQWDPGLRGHGSRVAVGGFGTYNNMRHYSANGKDFALLNNTDGFEGPHCIAGDYLTVVRTSDEMLMIADIPGVKTHRPLKLAPGADNSMSSATLDAGSAATTGNTRSEVSWNNGEFRYTSGGALVPYAPKVPAPGLNNPAYYLLDPGVGAAANYMYGSVYLQASGQTINIGSGVVGSTFALAPCSPNAVGRWSARTGVAGATNDSTAEIAIKTDWTQSWQPFSLFGDPINNPTAARGLMQLYAGPAFAQINPSCPILLAVGGLYVGQSVTPWPTGRLTTSNANEVASETLPNTFNNSWTVSAIVYRSMEQATIGTTPPAGTLFTVYRDANNYATVYFDGPNFEIEVTVTTGGVAGTTKTIAIEDWPRTGGLPIMLSDNGTDTVVSLVSNRNGLQQDTCTGNTLNGPPTSVRWSNAAQSSVYNFWTAGCEFRDEALTLQQQAVALRSLDFIDTNDELLAAASAKQVELQLAGAFDNTTADVWLQEVPTKTGTTGLRLSRIPDVAAGSAGGMFIAGTNAATTVNITGNVTGNLSGSIGSVGANGITASSIASAAIGNDEIATDAISAAEIADNAIDANTIQTNAIGASQVASDAIVEIQSGLALENSVDNVPTVAELNARTLATASYATAGQINDIETELLNVPTNAEFASGLDALPTAAENADAVFDEAMAGHTSIGTFGATASNTLTAANAAQSAAEDAVTNIEALPSSADIVTTLLNATLSDTGANKVGRALYYTVQSYESAGVFTEAALSGAAFPLTGTGLSNFNTFFNNGNAASTKTINNVTAPKNVTINVPQ